MEHYLTEPDKDQSMMMSLSEDELRAYADCLATGFEEGRFNSRGKEGSING